MNENDIIYKVAARAKDLCDKDLSWLRSEYSGEQVLTRAAHQASIGMSKGELVEAILLEEFYVEFPRNIEED